LLLVFQGKGKVTTYWLLGEKTPSVELGAILAGATAAVTNAVTSPVHPIGSFSKLHTANSVGSSSAKSAVTNNIANHNNITASTPLLQGDNG